MGFIEKCPKVLFEFYPSLNFSKVHRVDSAKFSLV